MAKYDYQIRPRFSRLHEDKDIPFIVPVQLRCVIGIVGKKFAGKSEIAKYLVCEHHFRPYSLASFVKEEAKRRCEYIDRSDPISMALKNLGDLLRKEEINRYEIGTEFHGGFISRMLVKKMWVEVIEKGFENPEIVVEGFKNPGEIRILRNFIGQSFFLIGVEAPDHLRYTWQKNQDGDEPKVQGSVGFKKAVERFKTQFDKPDLDELQDRPWGRNVYQCFKEVPK